MKLGWALAVVVEEGEQSGPLVVLRDELRVPDRFRIFGYHEAREAEPSEREGLVTRAAERAVEAATELLAEALADNEADLLAVVVGRGVRRIPIDRVLASTQLFHSAEAEILQGGFVEAASRLGVPCRRVPFAEVDAHEAWERIAQLGRVVGPPWQKDHKLAATAAWMALLSSG